EAPAGNVLSPVVAHTPQAQHRTERVVERADVGLPARIRSVDEVADHSDSAAILVADLDVMAARSGKAEVAFASLAEAARIELEVAVVDAFHVEDASIAGDVEDRLRRVGIDADQTVIGDAHAVLEGGIEVEPPLIAANRAFAADALPAEGAQDQV